MCDDLTKTGSKKYCTSLTRTTTRSQFFTPTCNILAMIIRVRFEKLRYFAANESFKAVSSYIDRQTSSRYLGHFWSATHILLQEDFISARERDLQSLTCMGRPNQHTREGKRVISLPKASVLTFACATMFSTDASSMLSATMVGKVVAAESTSDARRSLSASSFDSDLQH